MRASYCAQIVPVGETEFWCDGRIHLRNQVTYLYPNVYRAGGLSRMRCIFCKEASTSSKSVEHIFPESLGNTDHVLPPGWVCDQCNNYLARKVEAPFLNSLYGKHSRFEMCVPNKRGNIPPATGLHDRSQVATELRIERDGSRSIRSAASDDEKRFIKSLLSHKYHTLYVPAACVPPLDYSMSRFIGKIALAILAYRIFDMPGNNDEIVDCHNLNDLRDYVRRGQPGFIWPVNIRQLYPADFVFIDGISLPYEVLHEFTVLGIPPSPGEDLYELYVVIAIFGVEYTINCGGPVLDSYRQWLADNNNVSPLYMEQTESYEIPARYKYHHSLGTREPW